MFSVNAEFIIGVVFGDSYNASAEVLVIYAYTCVPVGLGVAMKLWAVNEEKNVVFVYNTILGAVVNIFLNIIYIPNYGAIGACIASLIAQFVSGYALNFFLLKIYLEFNVMVCFYVINEN